MRLRRKFKELLKIKEKMNDAIILVEGERDRSALEKIGFLRSKILTISGKNPELVLTDIKRLNLGKMNIKEMKGEKMNIEEMKGEKMNIEEMKGEKMRKEETVIILTDFDRKGKDLERRFFDELIPSIKSVDINCKRKLRWIFGIKTIEEIPAKYFEFVNITKSIGC